MPAGNTLSEEALTDSRTDIKAMIRSYMAEAEATYLDAVATNTLDEAVRNRLIEDVRTACERLVADGQFERVGLIRREGEMAEPSYRLRDDDGALAAEGYVSVPNNVVQVAATVFPLVFRPPLHHYGRWEDAMIEQLRLYEFISSYRGHEYMHGFEVGMNDKHPPSNQVPDGLLHQIQQDTLEMAEPVYVGADVCELIDHARDSFEVESVLPSDPFVPAGFCLLATPLMLHDIPGSENEMVPVRAISWMSAHSEDLSMGAFWISFYARMDEVPKYPAPQDWVGYPIFVAHMFQWQWGTKPLAERLEVIALEGEDMDAAHARATEQAQMVQTLWRLAAQFVPAKQRAPRGLRREAQRKMKRNLDDVIVMLLRRPSYDGDFDPSDRHLTVSFLVRGYWAIRHTRQGPKQTWVKPHVKGRGPFKETTRAWEFKR